MILYLVTSTRHSIQSNMVFDRVCHVQLSWSPLLSVDDIMKMMDDNIPVHSSILDFSKAFDKVPHGPLIAKLINTDIDTTIVRWIEKFLFDRHQRVVVEGVSSSCLAVTSGVPQGSVLGPSLFLVYINGICDNLRASTIRLCADDALLYCPINSPIDSFYFQHDLNMLGRWAEQWGMEFNTDKCQIVGFNRQDSVVNCTYFLNGKPLEQVSNCKYLGIKVSNNFDWDMHIDSVTAKASQRLGMIKLFCSMRLGR